MPYTLIIIIVTAGISILAFNNDSLYNNFILWPRHMDRPQEYYRLLSSGFIHANWVHLIFNMYALWGFGQIVEGYFSSLDKHNLFIILYLAGIVAASLPSYWKNRNNGYYRALGASGGVAAVLFSSTYISPWTTIIILIIPVPSIIAAIGYLIYSAYMSKQGRNNINHDAHFWGAVFGFVFTFLFDPTHGQIFLSQIVQPHFQL